MSRLPLRGLLAYGTLRLPLALLELPLFVLLPALYGGELGLPLALVGGTLFLARLLDAVADPLIGHRIARGGNRHARWILAGLAPLAAGFALLLHPPAALAESTWVAGLWLGMASLVAYIAYSAVTIAYQAWGAALASDDAGRARVTGVREAFGLAGVVAAAALLAPEHATLLATSFALLCLLGAVMLRFAPQPMAAPATDTPDAVAVRAPLRNGAFRWLLAVFVANGIASAVPATLVLFYIRDVLRAESLAGPMLVAYFAAGAVGMPAWMAAARRIGLRNAWLVGMACSVIAFVWTLDFGAGDTGPYLAVVLLTGFTLGADLALPPALLAGIVARTGDQGRAEAGYFGWWNLATKANLALAAGLALPLLEASGYRPGSGGPTLPLVLVYAGLPCVLKLVAAVLLWIAPLDSEDLPR